MGGRKEGHWHFGYIQEVFVAFVISTNNDVSVKLVCNFLS